MRYRAAIKKPGDWKTRRIVERTLQIMIELCIDIAGHIISDRRLRVPVSYANPNWIPEGRNFP
jgi:uncharacterized protein YutE (UPF0331/DUF86 family)